MLLLGLLGRAGARIAGQLNKGVSESISAEQPPSINIISRRFLETNGGIVDDGPCPEANAEDKPKCDVEKCQAATKSSVVSDVPYDHRHYGSAYDSGTQNA